MRQVKRIYYITQGIIAIIYNLMEYNLLKEWITMLHTQNYYNIVNQLSVQLSSAAQSCLTLCDPMPCSTPGFPVHHQLPEPAQTHVHWVNNATQPFHPLLSRSSPALNFSQHLNLFKWVRSNNRKGTQPHPSTEINYISFKKDIEEL